MKVFIACDKFRGSLEGLQVSNAIRDGILSVRSNLDVEISEIADGGEGSMELLSKVYACRPQEAVLNNAIGETIHSSLGYNKKTRTAILEMASYVGLAQLPVDQRDPSKTSSYGLGQAILKAIALGARKIILGIGGSATNDGGAGMLHALGFDFLDNQGNPIYPVGGNLDLIQEIKTPETLQTKDVEIIIASDVSNPIAGPSGATYTYGPQKGASSEDLDTLENNMIHFAQLIQKLTKNNVFDQTSYGAAGGIPLSACELLHATVHSGSELIFQVLRLNEKIHEADVVITGEGKIDHQTAQGKAISPIVKEAIDKQKKLYLVCGVFEDSEDVLLQAQNRFELSILAKELNRDSFNDASELCKEVGKRIADTMT